MGRVSLFRNVAPHWGCTAQTSACRSLGLRPSRYRDAPWLAFQLIGSGQRDKKIQMAQKLSRT